MIKTKNNNNFGLRNEPNLEFGSLMTEIIDSVIRNIRDKISRPVTYRKKLKNSSIEMSETLKSNFQYEPRIKFGLWITRYFDSIIKKG